MTAMLLTLPLTCAHSADMQPGEGLVVFSRADKFAGKAIRFNINVDGRPTGQLLAGSTIELPLPAGTHRFTTYSPSLDGQDSLTIDVREGWTYQVEGVVRMGWPTGRPKFRLISESGPEPGAAPPAAESSPALAGAALGAATLSAAGDADAVRSAGENGRIGLRNFVGEWQLDMWSLAADGSRLAGRGVAEGSAESDRAVRIYFREFAAPAFPEASGGGQVRIAYEPDDGFLLESLFTHANELLRFTGSYEPEVGRYVFFLANEQGSTATGIERKSTRVEIRSLDLGSWVAETYASVDGQSVLVQSYRFTRR